MKLTKNHIGWLAILFIAFSSITYAASSGTLGWLFREISSGTSENGVPLATNEYRLNGEDIEDNTVTTYEIKNYDIEAIDLATNSVTSEKIVDGTITADDLTGSLLLWWGSSLWSDNAWDIYYASGSVGIWTNTPTEMFEVAWWAIKAGSGLIIETRSDDPSYLPDGRLWLRNDL